MLRSLVVILALKGLLAAAALAGEPPRLVSLGTLAGLVDIRFESGRLRLQTEAGDYQLVGLPDAPAALAPVPAESAIVLPVPPDIIPHASVTHGRRDIRAAWLAGPTGRYAHGVLGDSVEASALKVETADGATRRHELADRSVFEDLAPRLADIDGDGRDEAIVVHSYPETGAAVSLFGLRDGRLAMLAESAPVGLANRWLNPVGAGDFDGDGETEIAVVRTPHIGGILILYRWRGDRLEEIARLPGYSTHAIGSTVLGMAAVLDLDGDGADDILLPDTRRSALHAVRFAGGAFDSLWTLPLSGRIATSLVAADIDGAGAADIVFGLADGSVMLLAR